MTFCITCGKENNETSKFCVGCGKPMVLAATANLNPSYPKTKKSNKSIYIFLGIVGVLAVGGLIYWFTKKTETVKTEITSNINNTSSTQNITTNNSINNITSSEAVQKVRNYFAVTLSRNFDEIFPYLSKCKHYYSIYNPSKDDIYNDCSKYWDKATDIEQEIKNVRIEKTDNYNDCFVTMDYSFYSIKDQTRKYINNLAAKVRLDANNNIIEIYEVSRN